MRAKKGDVNVFAQVDLIICSLALHIIAPIFYMRSILIIAVIIFVIPNLFAQCYKSGQNLPNTGYLFQSSGNVGLDAAVYSEIPKLEAFFGVNIDFFFILEDYSENALYLHECNHSCDGTIALGLKLLNNEYIKDPTLMTVRAVLAHEFGHCLQRLQGWRERGKRPELHADFLAGYYLHKMYGNVITWAILEKSLDNFGNKGDFNFWDPTHHGTPIERVCAFACGWDLHYGYPNLSIIQASQKGIDYVIADNPCGQIPTVRADVEKKITKQEQASSSNSYKDWKYDIRYINRPFKHQISIGYSPSKMSGAPVSFYYEKIIPNEKRRFRYNLQIRNKPEDVSKDLNYRTKYLSLGADLKNFLRQNSMHPSFYYSCSLNARYLRKDYLSDLKSTEKLFYLVPAMRFGIEGAPQILESRSWSFVPRSDGYTYCTSNVKYARVVLSGDMGLAYYTPIGKLGLEFNLILGYRFN
jgi:hypothetical protein